jgi:hypothetical protein
MVESLKLTIKMTETKKFIWAWRILVVIISILVISQVGINEIGFYFGLAALVLSFMGERWLNSIGKRDDGSHF